MIRIALAALVLTAAAWAGNMSADRSVTPSLARVVDARGAVLGYVYVERDGSVRSMDRLSDAAEDAAFKAGTDGTLVLGEITLGSSGATKTEVE